MAFLPPGLSLQQILDMFSQLPGPDMSRYPYRPENVEAYKQSRQRPPADYRVPWEPDVLSGDLPPYLQGLDPAERRPPLVSSGGRTVVPSPSNPWLELMRRFPWGQRGEDRDELGKSLDAEMRKQDLGESVTAELARPWQDVEKNTVMPPPAAAPRNPLADALAPRTGGEGDKYRVWKRNNPGNIRPRGQSTGFMEYGSPEEGVQAIIGNLRAYNSKHGINTIRGIVSRWAPPNENDTPRLVEQAAKRMGVDPDAPLDMKDPGVLNKIAGVIIQQEHGGSPVNVADYLGGGDMPQNPFAAAVSQKPPEIVGPDYGPARAWMEKARPDEYKEDPRRIALAYFANMAGGYDPRSGERLGHTLGRMAGAGAQGALQAAVQERFLEQRAKDKTLDYYRNLASFEGDVTKTKAEVANLRARAAYETQQGNIKNAFELERLANDAEAKAAEQDIRKRQLAVNIARAMQSSQTRPGPSHVLGEIAAKFGSGEFIPPQMSPETVQEMASRADAMVLKEFPEAKGGMVSGEAAKAISLRRQQYMAAMFQAWLQANPEVAEQLARDVKLRMPQQNIPVEALGGAY